MNHKSHNEPRKLSFFRQNYIYSTNVSTNLRDKNYPELHNFYDVINRSDELINAVSTHPGYDHVYHFPTLFGSLEYQNGVRKEFPESFANQKWDWCIAGSKAVYHIRKFLDHALKTNKNQREHSSNVDEIRKQLIASMNMRCDHLTDDQVVKFVTMNKSIFPHDVTDLLQQNLPDQVYGSFEPTDTDIFFLNSEMNHRLLLDNVDLVHTKAKSVEELLLNFDLPCCRAAFNSKHDFWISAQCLHSLLTGTYYLPSYLSNIDKFSGILEMYRYGDGLNPMDKHMYDRLMHRIEKYKGRGYNCVWTHTDEVQPWIKNRFHYGEWKYE